jgi:H+-transporting ATPase
MSEATAVDSRGGSLRILKGAYATVSALVPEVAAASSAALDFEVRGFRVLAVAAGSPAAMSMVGLIALSDPARSDSATLIDTLSRLGVRTVMVTGDAPATALIVARAVGIDATPFPPGPIPSTLQPDQYAIFSGVLPEDKYKLVKAFQATGHTVGMCGDGANDAPALRQAHMGIAVSTATDVAKSAAGMVLINPGLGGIVAAVTEGRITYQRILTYALNSVTKKIVQVLFLGVGLIMTGHAILTPMLMIIVMLAGDFLGMSLTTDHVRASPHPNRWNIGSLTKAGIVMGLAELIFCVGVVAIGYYGLRLELREVQTVAFVALVSGNQATMYAIRARGRIWSLPGPSRWLIASSVLDLAIAMTLATVGVLMAPVHLTVVLLTVAGAILFAGLVDGVKCVTFRHLHIT